MGLSAAAQGYLDFWTSVGGEFRVISESNKKGCVTALSTLQAEHEPYAPGFIVDVTRHQKLKKPTVSKLVDFRKSIYGGATLLELDIKKAVFDPVLLAFLNNPRLWFNRPHQVLAPPYVA